MSGLLYYRTVYKTGRALAKALGIPYGRETTRRTFQGHQGGPLIRWGNQQPCASARELNTPQALATASDKLRALQVLQEAGVSTPTFGTCLSDMSPNSTVFGRLRHGQGGRDIHVGVVGRNNAYLAGHEFYTEYVPNRFEARIHVFQGEVIRVQKKYLDFPDQQESEYIKNHANGFRFRAPRHDLHRSRTDAAVAAVEALGLDFGAVDLLVGTDDLEYVLEVNTAPSCSPLTARAYVDRFAEWLGVTPDYTELEALRASDQDRGVPASPRTPQVGQVPARGSAVGLGLARAR